ncbi:MAG: SDR family oxidoreductase [Bryobacterales bacterium]|nr:SDR family oxidoreductase [Bryobacteraceae bacterium]MDW8354821.1 SDR family oxidoreductase [Bryobacterales bacterium]
MAGRCAGKVFLITGATGIGAATARLAVAEGARVLVASLPVQSPEVETGEALDCVPCDLTRAADAEAAVARCLDRFGRLDGVFNVAGISGRRFGDGPLHECTEEGWDAVMAANLKTMFLTSRAAIRRMLGMPGPLRGAIVNMASVLADSPEARYFATHAYAASKGAVIALTRAMAAYYAPHGIRVNAVAPGLVRTPMSRRAQEDATILEYMRAKQPLASGLLDPEDAARAALFLLSDEARYITGEVLGVDGGWKVTSV